MAQPSPVPPGSPMTANRLGADSSSVDELRGTAEKGVKGRQRVLEQEESSVSKPGPLARMTQVVQGMQRTVLMYAPSFADKAQLYRQARYPEDTTLVPAFNWAAVLGELQSRAAIGRLSLFLEGTPGYFIFDRLPSGAIAPNIVSLKVAGDSVKALPKTAVLGTVELEGCNLAGDLKSVRDFGLAIRAAEISALNQFHMFGELHARGTPNDTTQLEKDVAAYDGYIATPNVRGWIALAKRQGIDRNFLIEWFVNDVRLGAGTLPADPAKRKGFNSRASMQSLVVRSAAELQGVQDVIDRDPRPSHVRIIL